MELCDIIKNLRRKSNMTQEQLAEKLGISAQSVSKWENAVAMPDIMMLPRISEVFGVSIDDLFDLTSEQKLNRIENRLDVEQDLPQDVFWDYEEFLKSQLKVDSPYNTYLHAGLPPGPIYVPTKAALDAVLNPDRGGGNLFFCADPSFNGSHRFAKNYAEHRRNARAFQSALDAKSIKN